MESLFFDAKKPISLKTLVEKPAYWDTAQAAKCRCISNYKRIHIVIHAFDTKIGLDGNMAVIDKGATKDYLLIPIEMLHHATVHYEDDWSKNTQGKKIGNITIKTAGNQTDINGLSDIMLYGGISDEPVKIENLLELYQFLMLVI